MSDLLVSLLVSLVILALLGIFTLGAVMLLIYIPTLAIILMALAVLACIMAIVYPAVADA